MNEKRVRKAAASVLALTMAASLTAVFVGANNYYKPPNYQPVSAGGSYSAPKNPKYKKDQNTKASILTADTVKDAIKNAKAGEAVISLSEDNKGNVTLMEDALAAIAKGKTEVAINVGGKNGKKSLYSVAIDPELIDNIDGSLNVGMDVDIVDEGTSVDGVKVPAKVVVVKPKSKVKFGATLKVTVPKEAFDGMDVSKVRPYVISGKGKNKKVVPLGKDEYVVNTDGSISVLLDTGNVTIVFTDAQLS